MKKTVSSLGLLIILSPLASAQDDSNFYLGARVGASLLDNTCQTTDCTSKEVGGGLIAGYDFANGFSIESTYDYLGRFETRSTLEGLKKGDLTAITLAPKLNFGVTETIDLYGKIGAVWWNWNDKPADLNAVTVMTALGIDHRASDLVNLRLEYQYIPGMDLNKAGTVSADSHFLSAGLTFHFGRTSTPAITTDESYQDNVVYDEVDVSEEVLIVEDVVIYQAEDAASFEFGKSSLSSDAIAKLESMLKRLQDYEQSTAIIKGYTDNVGPEVFNSQLSTDRAQSVSNYFSENGITTERMTVTGHGSIDPVAANDTKEGRAMNRRVEITSPEFIIEQF